MPKSPRKRIHLVCNAHLDPVWLWHWEDGLTEALSTYRIAADFAEKHRDFVFNHNESLLYEWVEEYEPQLFKRMTKLVRSGQWSISGGAYLQPDINGSSGESHIRQFLLARGYFEDRFGTYPKTAYNFDPFGHPEGFAQILAGCGIENYIFCRPSLGHWDLPRDAFRWQDRSGAEVLARRGDDHYLTFGNIDQKLDEFLPHYEAEPTTMILWGIGNHGGGPSREEYRKLKAYIAAHPEVEFVQSTPDQYFAERRGHAPEPSLIMGELQNVAPGCYTSMLRVKQGHRAAENLMHSTERLAALAWWWQRRDYPAAELTSAWKDILFAEFHDILPGSCSEAAETDSIHLVHHVQEKLRRLRLRCLLALISDDKAAADGAVPVYVVNPHGHRYQGPVEFELNLAHRGSSCRNAKIELRVAGKKIPFQRIHADAVSAGDWRQRLAAEVDIPPFGIIRIDESFTQRAGPKPFKMPRVTAAALRVTAGKLDVSINAKTGLIDRLANAKGVNVVKKGAFAPVMIDDLDHSWVCGTPPRQGGGTGTGEYNGLPLTDLPFSTPRSHFRLATAEEALALDPVYQDKWTTKDGIGRPIRILAQGPVRTIVEVLFVAEHSSLHRQYHLHHRSGTVEIRDRLYNNQRDTMIKLAVPLAFKQGQVTGDAIHGAVTRPMLDQHLDRPNQRWLAAHGSLEQQPVHLAVANDNSHAHAYTDDTLYMNLVRSPAYASFNIGDGEEQWRFHRFHPRQDQGQHHFRFLVRAGGRMREDQLHQLGDELNSALPWLVYYPQDRKGGDRGLRSRLADTIQVSDKQVRIVAVKRSESGKELIVRLHNPSSRARTVKLSVKPFKQAIPVDIGKYGLQTVAIRRGGKQLRWRLTNLVEQ